MAEEWLHLIEMQRPGTATAKDDRLPVRLIRDPIAIQAPRNRKHRLLRRISRDEPRHRTRAESRRPLNRIRRDKLHNPQAILPIRDKRIHRSCYGTNLHGMCVIQLAVRVEHLIELRPLRILNVYDSKPVRPIGDIGIGARHIELMRMTQAHHRPRHCPRMLRIGEADHLHPLVVCDKRVKELNCNGAWILQELPRQLPDQSRLLRIPDIHHSQSARRADIDPVSRTHTVFRPGEAALRIKFRGLLDEVILRISIEQSPHVTNHKPQLAVADKRIAIPRRNRLLLVVLVLNPHRIVQQRARQRDRGRKRRANISLLP